MLRAEQGGDVQPRRDQRVEAVSQVRRHRCGMREQRDALALKRLAQFRFGEQPIDAEVHLASFVVMPDPIRHPPSS